MTVALGTNIANPISTALSQWLGFDTMGKLANYGKLGVTDPDAVINALFANSEQGVFYDPSDLTTMFQDRAGTTPDTADGQPVGLILDKSKGLVLGSEINSNPGPFTTTTGFNGNGSTLTVSGGILTSTGTATPADIIYDFSGVTVGKTYELEVVVTGVTINSCSTQSYTPNPWTNSITGSATIPAGGSGTIRHRRTATDTSMRFRLFGSAVGGTISVSKYSIKELSGNHAVAPSDAARPLKTSTSAADWINYDAVDDVLNSTFPSSLGSSCTVCRANVGAAPTILTAQTIGTSYADSTDNAGLIIINRALTAQETTDVTAWLLAKGATS